MRDYQFNKKVKKIFDFIPNKIISNSKNLKKYYNDNDKYVVIPNGMNLKIIKEKYTLIYREKFDIEDDEIVFGIASNFARWKGIDYLIKGFYETQKENNSFKAKILIAGEPKGNDNHKYYLELKELVKNLGLDEQIIFIGWIDDILEFFYNCDIIVSSSISDFGGPESFGRTIIEAWAVKKAIIVTDVGAPKNIVEDNISGLKVKEKDPNSIKNAILQFYNNRNLIKQFGEIGYKIVKEKYNLQYAINQYRREIEELL